MSTTTTLAAATTPAPTTYTFAQGFPIPGLSQVVNTLIVIFVYAGWQLMVLIYLVVRAQRKYQTNRIENLINISHRTPPWIKLFQSYHTIFVHMAVTSLTWGIVFYMLQEQKFKGFNGQKQALYLTCLIFGYRFLSGLNLWIVDYTLIKPNARLARAGTNVICSAENKSTARQLLYQMLDINVFIELSTTFEESRPEVTIQFRDIRTMEALFVSTFSSIFALDFILEKQAETGLDIGADSTILIVAIGMAWWSITSVLIKRDEVVFFEFREEANECRIVPHMLYIGRRFWRFCEVGSRLLILTMLTAGGRGWGFIVFGLLFTEVIVSIALHVTFRREKFVYEFIYALEFIFAHPNIAMEASDRWKNGYYSFRFYEHCIILMVIWLWALDQQIFSPAHTPFLVLWLLAVCMTIVTRVGFFLLRFYMSLPSFDKLIMSDQYPDEIEIQIRQHPHYLHDYHNKEPMQIAIDASACNNFKWLKNITGGGERMTMLKLSWKSKNLSKWDISGMNFQRSNLFNTNFRQAICIKTKFSHAILSGCNFHRANMEGARLKNAQMKGCDLSMVRLSNAILEGANLSNANMIRANLTATNFRKANMSLSKLHGAELDGSVLQDVDFSGANLFRTSFVKTDLTRAKFRFSNCKLAKFTEAKLFRAQFYGATGADFVDDHAEVAPRVRNSLYAQDKDSEEKGYAPDAGYDSSSSSDQDEREHSATRPRGPSSTSSRVTVPQQPSITFTVHQSVDQAVVSVSDEEKQDDKTADDSSIAYLNPEVRQLSANSDSSANSTTPLGVSRTDETSLHTVRVVSTTATETSSSSGFPQSIQRDPRRESLVRRAKKEDVRHEDAAP